MFIKQVKHEDFVNYIVPSMFIGTSFCDWKCCVEGGMDREVCQNAPLATSKIVDVSNDKIFNWYTNNPITKAVVIGGLEPMLQIDEVVSLIRYFRDHKEDCLFVIYTGYYPHEIECELESLRDFKNIIVKFGRYVPDKPSRYDSVLGVTLASDNQYAEILS